MKIIYWIIGILIVLVGGFYALNGYIRNEELGESETEPIGNYVEYIDPVSAVSFDYPEKLEEQYISTVDWPPKVQVLNEPFKCTEAGSEIERAGVTELISIGGRDFCVTRVTEGAAGSIYTQYAYAFSRDNRTIILDFSLRFPQCLNYDEPKQSECKAERETFSMDPIIVNMAATLKLPDSSLPVGTPGEDETVFCTMDAKICPDGSYVGRVPPRCEFSPCPGE